MEEELNLSDEQMLALDQAEAQIIRNNENISDTRHPDINNRRSTSRTQAEFNAEAFEGFTEDQFAALDKDIENCANRVDNNQNDITVVQTQRESREDLFAELGNADFESFDREIENFRTIALDNQPEERHETDTNSTVTASQFELAAAVFEDDEAMEPSLEHLECLKSRFGHNQFKDKQWEIIHSVMNEKRDVLAVMATGYGKSLCFQFPAVYKNGMVLVISPLIALMQAQVRTLNAAKIPACFVGSAQPDRDILPRIYSGKFNVIYSSPEYLQGDSGGRMLNALKNRLTLIAIDESHCVSAWGLDFRPDFRRLNIIRSIVSNTPILALTATATARVRHDIKSSLGLINPKEILTSFDRPNLEFIVHEKSSSVWNDLAPWVTNVEHTGSIIIYVLKRVEASNVAQKLQCHGVHCQPYHAGMERDQRKSVLEAFLDNRLKVIVATIAFGMGIDKRNIRTIIHYGASKNLESYFQEVGRAGRDGLPSKVVTYFAIEDFDLQDYFLEKEGKEEKLTNFVKKYLRNLALHIREFLYSTECRRKIILRYFGESIDHLQVRNDCCDNCARGLSSWKLCDLYVGVDDENQFDFAKDAQILLSAIRSMESNSISPERQLITKLLRGETARSLMKLPEYGKGVGRKQYYWGALIDQLMSNEYIDFVAGKTCMTLDKKGLEWCKQPHPKTLKLKPVGTMYKFLNRKPSTPLRSWTRGYNENPCYRSVEYGSMNYFGMLFGLAGCGGGGVDDDSDDFDDYYGYDEDVNEENEDDSYSDKEEDESDESVDNDDNET